MTTIRCNNCLNHGPCFISNKSEARLSNAIDNIGCILNIDGCTAIWRRIG